MPCPSSKAVAIPGKAQSSRKHHPFSAMAAVVAQSARAAKKRPHSPDGEDGVKQAHKKLPSILLRKSALGVSRSLIIIDLALWHYGKFTSIKEVPNYYVEDSVWHISLGKLPKISK